MKKGHSLQALFKPSAMPVQATWLISFAILSTLYYFTARWSLLLSFEGTNASPVWPPSGIALGAMLLLGPRIWPAITLGAFGANMAVFSAAQVVDSTTAVWVSSCIAAGNTLEALCGIYLLQRLKLVDVLFQQPQNVFKFVMVALIMCSVSAGIGTMTMLTSGIAPLSATWPVWINWWLGDVGGVLIVAPLIYSWFIDRSSPAWLGKPREAVLQLIAFSAAALWIFSGDFSNGHLDRLLLYLFIPGLACVAYRFGARGVSLMSFLLAGIAIWSTAHNYGPFALGDLNNSLILLMSFITLCCMVGLVLASDIAQRTHLKHRHVNIKAVITPWGTLLAALAITILTWHMVSVDTENTARQRFNTMVEDLRLDINQRMLDYELILRGGAAVFSATPKISPAAWRSYIEQLNIEQRFPGMEGMAFVEWVSATEKEAYIRRMRAQGPAEYDIWPQGKRDAYVPVNYIEPLSLRNQRVLGFDTYSEPVRRAAINHARDTGKASISGKVHLAQDDEESTAGFVMFVPVYRYGMPLTSMTQRQAALLGFASSAFRMDDLMQSILGQHDSLLGLEVFDNANISSDTKMFSSASLAHMSEHDRQRSLVSAVSIEIGDHFWTLQATSLPAFEASIDRQKAQIMLMAGIVVSLLLFILVRSLAMTRENALILADGMTAALRKSETQLRLANTRMGLATEAGGIGVWDWDIAENTLTWDERMREMYQIPSDIKAITYDTWRGYVHPDDLVRVESDLNETLTNGTPFSLEFGIVLRDGHVRKIKANGLVVRNEWGQPSHMIGINLDITDLRQTEESLLASEKRFRSILEHAPIGMALISLNGRWLEVNDAVCNIVGYSKEELSMLTFQDITYPDDLEKDIDYVQQLLDDEIPFYQMQKRYIRKDRQIVWALLAVSLMRDEQNAPSYFISQIEDISELKFSEAKLQEALALRSAILSSANQSIIATDTEGWIVSVNRAAEEMLGYSKAELIRIHSLMLLHDEEEVEKRAKILGKELDRHLKPGFDVLVVKAKAGLPDENEWMYIRKDGSRFPVSLTMTAIRNQAGDITGYLGVASDISDRKQKEHIIRAALAEKEMLLKEVYHRVKNNLQVITSLFNLQLNSLPYGPARTALEQGAERVYAMALVHQKLYQSQSLSSIALDGYIRDICKQFAEAAAIEQRGISLSLMLEPVEIGIETAVPLGLILNEIISNSLKHAFPEGRRGEIKVTLSKQDEDTVKLSVADDGAGMPAGLDFATTSTLGLKLISTLSGQLDAELDMKSDKGTVTSVIFKIFKA